MVWKEVTQEELERGLKETCARLIEMSKGTVWADMRPELVSCDVNERTCVVAFEVQPWMGNPVGVLHGGMMATAMDIAMGMGTIFWSDGCFTPSISLQVNYARPVPLGKRLLVRGKVDHAGRTMCCASGTAWAEDTPDKTAATATGVYFVDRGEQN